MNEELIREKFNETKDKLNNHEKRIDELEKTYSIMKQMDFRMGTIEDSVKKIDKKLEENGNEKGKKWDKFIDYIFYFFISAV